jgi:hypothetical protein
MRLIIAGDIKTDSDRGSSRLRLLVAGILVVVLALLLLFGASACSPGGDSSGGPHIQFEHELIDLGTASPGDSLHAEFHFRNAGNETLKISEITTEVATDGC